MTVLTEVLGSVLAGLLGCYAVLGRMKDDEGRLTRAGKSTLALTLAVMITAITASLFSSQETAERDRALFLELNRTLYDLDGIELAFEATTDLKSTSLLPLKNVLDRNVEDLFRDMQSKAGQWSYPRDRSSLSRPLPEGWGMRVQYMPVGSNYVPDSIVFGESAPFYEMLREKLANDVPYLIQSRLSIRKEGGGSRDLAFNTVSPSYRKPAASVAAGYWLFGYRPLSRKHTISIDRVSSSRDDRAGGVLSILDLAGATLSFDPFEAHSRYRDGREEFNAGLRLRYAQLTFGGKLGTLIVIHDSTSDSISCRGCPVWNPVQIETLGRKRTVYEYTFPREIPNLLEQIGATAWIDTRYID